MRRFRRSLAFLILAVAAIAQTSSQIESEAVQRVGKHLKCTCGCNMDLNCTMSSGQCHICRPARTQIFQMQQQGQSDDTIIASFVKSGQFIFLSDPNSSFWAVPYVSLAFGGLLVWMVLKRWGTKKPRPVKPAVAAVAADDADYARYRDAIERDTEKLD